jgi:flagellum-specific ATP synthase
MIEAAALQGFSKIRHLTSWPVHGLVERVTGNLIVSRGPRCSLSDACKIESNRKDQNVCIDAEVVGFRDGLVLLMPLGDITGITPGDLVRQSHVPPRVPAGDLLIGRVLDAMAEPIDDNGPLIAERHVDLIRKSPDAFKRPRIDSVMATGIKSIDGMLTCGRGQRLGIFAGAGVGKSVLLGMIARMSEADVNVIALIGERGREVREFIDRDLAAEGLKKSVVIVVPSDAAPLLKKRGALVATAIAESFRDQGKNVLLMMDSLTRVAMAQREIGLAAGEPPTTRGYTPSVFTLLPNLLERTGRDTNGSITAFYTILVEADDMTDPVADASRSILDGHILLNRKLADRGHYPAVDVLASLSRVRNDIIDEAQFGAACKLQSWMAAWEEAEELIQIGAYQKGTDPLVDIAINRRTMILGFLQQSMREACEYGETKKLLEKITR